MPPCGCRSKPGTNVPVFSAMAHVIVKEGLVNQEFIDAAHRRLRRVSSHSLEKFTPEYAESISGVDREPDRRRRRACTPRRQARRHLLGHGHLPALARHRQRPGADPPGAAHRPYRARGHRPEPAARAEQRAGRLRYGRHALPLPRLHAAWTTPPTPRKWEQAWNIEPGGLNRKRGLTTTEILSHAHPGGVRALYIMGENPMMTEPNLNHDPPPHAAARVPGRAGSVYQRIRRFCRCLPAGGLLGGERRHLHQHRPARAARAPGACRRAASPAPTGRSSATWRSASRAAWAVPTRPAGITRTRPRSWTRWAASCPSMPA